MVIYHCSLVQIVSLASNLIICKFLSDLRELNVKMNNSCWPFVSLVLTYFILVLNNHDIWKFICINKFVLFASRFLSEYRFDISKLEPLVAKVSST